MAYQSSYATIGAAIRAALARTGVNTGGTADYPRVELHTFIEGEPLDKEGKYRIMTATMESLSVVSPDAAAQLNEDNLTLLGAYTYTGTGWSILGIIPKQMTQSSETADSQALYRVAQTIDIHIQKA